MHGRFVRYGDKFDAICVECGTVLTGVASPDTVPGAHHLNEDGVFTKDPSEETP